MNTFDGYTMFYGSVLAVVLMLSWGSKNHVTQKLAFLMAVSWGLSNASVAFLGYAGAPFIVPSINAVLALLIGVVGFANRDWVCLTVFGLFGLEILISVVAFATHHNGEWVHYAALNAVFMLRMLVVGGSAVVDLVRRPLGEHSRTSSLRVDG